MDNEIPRDIDQSPMTFVDYYKIETKTKICK